MKVLILANSKFKGGTSGSDEIYANFKKYWPCDFISSEYSVEYSPFFLCYLQRIIVSICRALADRRECDLVYSSSDFLADAIPGFIYKLKGKKWIAGFFLKAFRDNPAHYWSQKVVRKLIEKFADMVIVTNPKMYDIFPDTPKTWCNGGIDLSLAGISDKPKIYDAVFCGRIHPSKGIDQLLTIWSWVIKEKPDAKLAIIGDGDLGVNYIRFHPHYTKGITLLGYMGQERYDIYKQSKVVLYPTPLKYDHFSMAPVEAMSCGCPMVCFENPVNLSIADIGCLMALNIEEFSYLIMALITDHSPSIMNENAIKFAQQYDYKKQVMRVWDDITKELYAYPHNGVDGNGRKLFMPSLKQSRSFNT